jgi:hypothetical protein
MGISIPGTVGLGAAALMPVHSGFLRNAMAADHRAFMRDLNLNRELGFLRQALASGKCDNMVWLNQMTDRLRQTEYPNQGMAHAAREIIALADARKRQLASQYREEIKKRPDLRPHFDSAQPGWDKW